MASKRTEACVITFGGRAQVEIPFTEGRNLQPKRFQATGGTPLGGALLLALDELESQKAAYRSAELEYYRPWLFVFTDGHPTDHDVFERAAGRVRELEDARGVTVFSVYVPGGAPAELRKLSAIREPLQLKTDPGVFRSLFAWLSASMGQVSTSTEFGTADGAIPEGQTKLPSPEGWATW